MCLAAKYQTGSIKKEGVEFQHNEIKEILPATLDGLLEGHKFKNSSFYDKAKNMYFVVSATLNSKSIDLAVLGDKNVEKALDAVGTGENTEFAVRFKSFKDEHNLVRMHYDFDEPLIAAIRMYELKEMYVYQKEDNRPAIGEVLDKPVKVIGIRA